MVTHMGGMQLEVAGFSVTMGSREKQNTSGTPLRRPVFHQKTKNSCNASHLAQRGSQQTNSVMGPNNTSKIVRFRTKKEKLAKKQTYLDLKNH